MNTRQYELHAYLEYLFSKQEVEGGMRRKRVNGKTEWMIGKCNKEIWAMNLMTQTTLKWPCMC